MKIHSFAYEIETEYFYKSIAERQVVETRFDASRYSKDDNRPLSLETNIKIVRMMKDKFSGRIMSEFVALRAKFFVYKKLGKK